MDVISKLLSFADDILKRIGRQTAEHRFILFHFLKKLTPRSFLVKATSICFVILSDINFRKKLLEFLRVAVALLLCKVFNLYIYLFFFHYVYRLNLALLYGCKYKHFNITPSRINLFSIRTASFWTPALGFMCGLAVVRASRRRSRVWRWLVSVCAVLCSHLLWILSHYRT